MKKQVKQWLMVNGEIYRTAENVSRFYALLYWNVRHWNANLRVNIIKKDNKLMYIATLEVQDNEEQFKEFCKIADKVNGLYDVSEIIYNAVRVFNVNEKSNKE